ncbi:hypothetical protein OCU04_008006 [Sclerotinia nivalis]|uniref:Uncharacterized protein n=1 Tax=Sclerotinia nivalis TaxID=352851 RepID=A0A9X0AKR4_9HELO|nr:hypothetical protein OCU04_008006 [Sclerotinia nivalis]
MANQHSSVGWSGEFEDELGKPQSLSKSPAISDVIRRTLGPKSPLPNSFDSKSLGIYTVGAIAETEQYILWGKEKKIRLRNHRKKASRPNSSVMPLNAEHANRRSTLNVWIKQMQQFSMILQVKCLEIIKLDGSLANLKEIGVN